jgi:hypothetical protein
MPDHKHQQNSRSAQVTSFGTVQPAKMTSTASCYSMCWSARVTVGTTC